MVNLMIWRKLKWYLSKDKRALWQNTPKLQPKPMLTNLFNTLKRVSVSVSGIDLVQVASEGNPSFLPLFYYLGIVYKATQGKYLKHHQNQQLYQIPSNRVLFVVDLLQKARKKDKVLGIIEIHQWRQHVGLSCLLFFSLAWSKLAMEFSSLTWRRTWWSLLLSIKEVINDISNPFALSPLWFPNKWFLTWYWSFFSWILIYISNFHKFQSGFHTRFHFKSSFFLKICRISPNVS